MTSGHRGCDGSAPWDSWRCAKCLKQLYSKDGVAYNTRMHHSIAHAAGKELQHTSQQAAGAGRQATACLHLRVRTPAHQTNHHLQNTSELHIIYNASTVSCVSQQ